MSSTLLLQTGDCFVKVRAIQQGILLSYSEKQPRKITVVKPTSFRSSSYFYGSDYIPYSLSICSVRESWMLKAFDLWQNLIGTLSRMFRRKFFQTVTKTMINFQYRSCINQQSIGNHLILHRECLFTEKQCRLIYVVYNY